MFGFNPNQIFNIALAMVLAAVATAASLELRSQPIEVSKLVSDAAGVLAAGKSAVSGDEAPTQKIALAREIVKHVPAKMEIANDRTSSLPAVETKENAQVTLAESAPMPVPVTLTATANETPAAPATASATAATPTAPAAATPAPAAAKETKETKVAALPTKPGVIFEDVGHKACIGGTQCEAQCKVEVGGCEVKQTYTVKLDQPTYISALQFFAHDDVGSSRRSELFVKVNGESIGKIEAHRYGSTRTVKVGRVGQLVTIESRHKHNGFLMGGEEAVIWDVYLLGREAH